ncbi:hypothetical protein [Streptomyces benahoarensis]|uniref:Uncharacterized protein n=1 Tax=Streptomyces benahoarensis TaxID=2595054 RepID=A0A553ZME5_9ACTN|nr:hypothetical protein [Streptomyces benahoarensis]TSB24597.1 hypothetical protein FNJ62_13900 [Streptomyces benahoarensis]TSB42654.1 hypothetical protein FNZ23_08725 [Streptomyces benahoarensis]
MTIPSVLLAASDAATTAGATGVSHADDGPGWLLRGVIIVGVLGAILLAWILLRGYGDSDDN